jgi:hypothetical protein
MSRASLLAAAPMYCSAAKRCLNTACRGKGRGLQTSRRPDTTPLTKPQSEYFGLGCAAFRRAAYSNVGAMEFGA